MDNTIRKLFDTYTEAFRGTYVVENEDDMELQAFAHGVIAALSLLGILPEDIENEATGRTIQEEIEGVLHDRAGIQ